MSMSATQRAAVPGNAPADEEGSSSKQAASAVTAFGTAPGKTPPAAAHSGALSIHETAERLPSPVAATVRTTSCYVSHWKSDNEGSEDGGDDSEGSDDDGDDSEDCAGTTSSRGKDDYDAPSQDKIMELANGFVPDKLTQKGKEARDAMKRTRVQADKRNEASRECKKKRQGK